MRSIPRSMKAPREHGLPRTAATRLLFVLGAALVIGLSATIAQSGLPPGATGPDSALAYLHQVMDLYHDRFDVYSDADAGGNHFHYRELLWGPRAADSLAVPVMDEACCASPHSGSTCIRATFDSRLDNWGGWQWTNGVLRGNEQKPRANCGADSSSRGAGYDLTGARRLTFWARGEKGGERVEFFAFGWNHGEKHRRECLVDSSRRESTGYVRLSRHWKQYEINLRGKNLQSVICGFGWVSSAMQNRRRDVAFYLDDIAFDLARSDSARFLRSFETEGCGRDFDRGMRDVAFVYDNAVTLIAFLAVGDAERARRIGDAFLYVQEHDRWPPARGGSPHSDGRIRNAYQPGDVAVPPGWAPHGNLGAARLPGWYDPHDRWWYEDATQVGTSTGNIAWAGLSLLSLYEKTKDARYLNGAERMAKWVDANCRARSGPGYTGGFEGWREEVGKEDTLMFKSTEHNLDLLVLFERLARLRPESARLWRERAAHAASFIATMWDESGGKFWTGSTATSDSANAETVPLDVQAWAVQALGPRDPRCSRAIAFAEEHHRVAGGYDFNDDRDGIWYEGTAQMAVSHRLLGNKTRAAAILDSLSSALLPTGALSATDRSTLTTGLHLRSGCPWLYHPRPHIAPTAWYVLAARGVNLFWFPASGPGRP